MTSVGLRGFDYDASGRLTKVRITKGQGSRRRRLPDQRPRPARFQKRAEAGAAAAEQKERRPGQYSGPESSLAQNWNRDYNARTGRYAQSDLIGLEGGINTFGYVGGNPLTRADATGLFFDEAGTYAVPAVAAAVVTSPGWALRAAAAVALGGLYTAIIPERCEHDEEKCRKILEEIYRYMNTVNRRVDEMQVDQHRLFDFAYDKPFTVGPLAGMGTWTGHYRQASGWQEGLRNLIREALRYKCKIPHEAWEAAYRKIPMKPQR